MISRLRIATLVAGVLASACSRDPGSRGVEIVAEAPQPAGPGKPQMGQGPQGAPWGAPGVVWKDTTGKVVERSFMEGNELRHIDASGHVWTVDRSSGQVWPAFFTDRLYYTSNDCSGPAFADYGAPPRYTTALWPVAIWAQPDSETLTTITACSRQFSYGCFPMDCEDRSVRPVDALPGFTLPNLGLEGPLHPEMP